MMRSRRLARSFDLAGWIGVLGMAALGCRSSASDAASAAAPDAANPAADASASADGARNGARNGAASGDASPPAESAASSAMPVTRAEKEQNALAILAGDPAAGDIAESTDERSAAPAALSFAAVTVTFKVVAGDADAFRAALLTIKAAEKRCYLRGLQEDANMQGKVRIQVAVSARGDVDTAVLLNGGLSSPVARCCGTVLRRAVEAFPSPKETQVVVELAFLKAAD